MIKETRRPLGKHPNTVFTSASSDGNVANERYVLCYPTLRQQDGGSE